MQNNKPFCFSHKTFSPGQALLERVLGILPGLFSWMILIGITVLAFIQPLKAAMVIIAYHIYWLFRLLYMTLFMALAFGVHEIEKGVDWVERCRCLEEKEQSLVNIRKKIKSNTKLSRLGQWFCYKNQARELKHILKHKVDIPKFDDLYHIVIIAVARESRKVVEPGIKVLAKDRFPTNRIVPVLAVEERSGESQRQMALDLKREYGSSFMDFIVAIHPDGIEGESRVKGANVTYAAKQAADYFASRNIPFENVIVSCFDADTVASPEYFMALTYHFMRHPNRTRASFQPIPVYHNNIWEAPGFARVLEMGSSFFQLVEATNPEKLVTFSSHSMSFKALVEIGYWPVDMISDDSAIFWKAYIYYHGKYQVIPMYVTLSMDVTMAKTRWKTLLSVYRQKRRWAWGVENFPIVIRGFLKDAKIPLIDKLRHGGKLLEMHVSWATVGFLIAIIGWLPAIFAGREFSSSVVYYNSARITQLIFNLALSGLAVTIILSLLLLPRKKTRNPFLKRVLFAIEWLLVPLVFTFLSSLPALDAQTRLMSGKGMEFRISEKTRR